ncbi:hypothetical protein Barb6XT_02582 [Bacteroidales bacterium Barb6XT]|nr:hypothetical protein Barb6XT_02582 [Bacteroidales bacterium Barb6XT]
MKQTRRTFFKQGIAGAMLLGAGSWAAAATPDPVKAKAAKTANPFRLGMAGFTFVNFDLDTTLKTLERLDVHYLCIKDFHLPFKSTDEWRYVLSTPNVRNTVSPATASVPST